MSDHLRALLRTGCDLLLRFRRDQSGNYLIIAGLMMPALVGIVGLGTDYGLWTYTHQAMQSAADSAAVSAATAYNNVNTSNIAMQANAVTGSYGFVNGTNGVVVTVNRPPQSGNYTASAGAVEVIVQQPQTPIFSALLKPGEFTITARSVARGRDGKGCVLSLSGAASGATTGQGSTTVDLKNCSLYDNSANASALTVGGSARVSARSVSVVGGISGQAGISTTQGVKTGAPPARDPYADVQNPTPSGTVRHDCDGGPGCPNGTATLDPGIYKNGMKIAAGANIKLNPGTYYLQGDLDVAGGATLTGDGVTLVFTSSNGTKYASATINGNANINLTAPTSGPTAGIVMFGDRNMPVGTSFKFNGGATQSFRGAIYIPKGSVNFAGGANTSTGCTQLVADTITFSGNSNFAINCTGAGTKPLGSSTVALVE